MQDHYLPHQYNLAKIIYDTPEVIDGVKKTIKIYDTLKGKPLYIQTPELVNIFGVIKKKNYSEILLPLGGIHAIVFKNFINNLENKILKDANANKNSWFSLNKSSEQAVSTDKKIVNTKSVKFIPLIKEINMDAASSNNIGEQTEHLDKCHDGVIKIKITSNTIIKKDSNEISTDELVKNNKLRIILQIYAIWITMTPIDEDKTSYLSTFGVYLKPEIIEERTSYNLAFIEEEKIIFDSDEESDIESDEESDD